MIFFLFYFILYKYCGGDKLRSPHQYICWAKDPAQRRTPPRLGKAEDKRDDLSMRMTLQTVPWKRISIKKEKDKWRPGNIYGKVATITLSALQLTEPYFSAFTTTPNDFGKGLMGQTSSLST